MLLRQADNKVLVCLFFLSRLAADGAKDYGTSGNHKWVSRENTSRINWFQFIKICLFLFVNIRYKEQARADGIGQVLFASVIESRIEISKPVCRPPRPAFCNSGRQHPGMRPASCLSSCSSVHKSSGQNWTNSIHYPTSLSGLEGTFAFRGHILSSN